MLKIQTKLIVYEDNIVKKDGNEVISYKIGEGMIQFLEFNFLEIDNLIDKYIDKFTNRANIEHNDDLDKLRCDNFLYILKKLKDLLYFNCYYGEDLVEDIFDRFLNRSLLKYKDQFQEFEIFKDSDTFEFDVYNKFDITYFQNAFNNLFDFSPKIQINIEESYNEYKKYFNDRKFYNSPSFSYFNNQQLIFIKRLDRVLNLDNAIFSVLNIPQRFYLDKYLKELTPDVSDEDLVNPSKFKEKLPLIKYTSQYQDLLDFNAPSYAYESNIEEEYSLKKHMNEINSISDIIEIVKKGDCTLTKSYKVPNINQMLELELYLMIETGVSVKTCKNCGSFFIAKGRIDTKYCDKIVTDEGKTCKDVGAVNSYNNKIKQNPVLKEYIKAYKRNYARVKYKKITAEEFRIWSEKAQHMKNDTLNGEIYFDDFRDWLNLN